MLDRTPPTPDVSRSRSGDTASPAHPCVGLTGVPDEPDAEPATPSVATEELRALASPTLAALYASQGHGEMAAAIYAQLVQRGSCPGGRTPGSTEPSRLVSERIIGKLVALRQAARRRRAAAEAAALRTGSENSRHGR